MTRWRPLFVLALLAAAGPAAGQGAAPAAAVPPIPVMPHPPATTPKTVRPDLPDDVAKDPKAMLRWRIARLYDDQLTQLGVVALQGYYADMTTRWEQAAASALDKKDFTVATEATTVAKWCAAQRDLLGQIAAQKQVMDAARYSEAKPLADRKAAFETARAEVARLIGEFRQLYEHPPKRREPS